MQHSKSSSTASPDDFPKNPRTIRRDLLALEVAGFPLFNERRDGQTVWRLMDGAHEVTRGTLNTVVCPACGSSSRNSDPFLYHDMKKNLMFYVAEGADAGALQETFLTAARRKWLDSRHDSKRGNIHGR